MEYILKTRRIRKKTKHWRDFRYSERLLSIEGMDENTHFEVKK